MPIFGKSSSQRLVNAHFDLARVLKLAITRTDFSISCTYRGQADQEAAFVAKKSNAHWLQSPHNFIPALAADLAPNPLDWNNLQSFRDLAKVIIDCGKELGVKITWGGDWDNDPRTQNHFNDFPHFELTDWRTISKQHDATGKIA